MEKIETIPIRPNCIKPRISKSPLKKTGSKMDLSGITAICFCAISTNSERMETAISSSGKKHLLINKSVPFWRSKESNKVPSNARKRPLIIHQSLPYSGKVFPCSYVFGLNIKISKQIFAMIKDQGTQGLWNAVGLSIKVASVF